MWPVHLHLGHHRPAQRGDAVARQSVGRGGGLCRRRGCPRRPTTSCAYLPMAWIGKSLFSLVAAPCVGFTCNSPESPETVLRDLRELGPTVALAPPRIWENMLTPLLVRAADASRLKRRIFGLFRGLAERAEVAARRRRKRCRRCCGSASRSAKCWFTARCATSSACAARAGSIPAARRSAPTPSASSARSGSI